MNATQKAIKYLAIALAVLLIVSIVNGIVGILRAFDYFFSSDTDTKDATVYTVSSAIHTVEMEIGGAEGFPCQCLSLILAENIEEHDTCQHSTERTNVDRYSIHPA